jgi:uroporphyrinogen-III synthase
MRSKASVLVTRPLGAAAPLCEALSSLGYTAHQQALLELHALAANTPEIETCIDSLQHYQHLIFISGNAVHFGMQAILARKKRLPQGMNVYAIGLATAKSLEGFGLSVIDAAPEMTSESLLELESLQQVEGQKILIIKGEGGRTTLRDTLSARGAEINELACYERKCPQLSPGDLAVKIAQWNIDVVLLSSGEGFCNMLTLLSPDETINLYAKPLIVPSARVALMARNAGFTAVHEAKNATNSAMLEAVEQLQL